MRWTVMIMASALAGCAATPEQVERQAATNAKETAGLEQALAGLAPGARSTCLPVAARTQTQTDVYGDAIVYRVSGDLKYVNNTTGGCERAGVQRDILVSRQPTGRACRGDIVQTVDPVARFATGSCALGDFVEYRRR